MAKKEGNFFELYIEKIVLILVGIIATFLFIFFVVLPPCKVKFNNKTFTAVNIDSYIDKEAQFVKEDCAKPPQGKPPYKSVKDEFEKIINKAFLVEPDLFAKYVPIPTMDDSAKQKYDVPQMIEIDNVAAEFMRTVAYVPITDVVKETGYAQNNSEPNDIDIVTVQGQIDTTILYENFKEVFNGDNVQENWRSEKFAKPVFAAVHLQRQEILPQGDWSDFKDVPRAKIETNKELFQIVEDVEKLPVGGGLNIRLLLYSDNEIQTQLVQPKPYVMATAEEQWLPPEYHDQYLNIVSGLKEQAIRSVREQMLRGRTKANVTGGRGARGGRGEEADAERGGRQDSQISVASELTKLKGASPELETLNENFQSRALDQNTKLENAEKPLLFWAFDDTVTPGKSYRYRIRLGVFNPIAGTDKFIDTQNPNKNNCVLFSKFVDAKQVITVPQKTFFFPVSKSTNSTKVSVDVYAYKLGHWYKDNFSVNFGEMIGKTLENPDYNSDNALERPVSSRTGRGGLGADGLSDSNLKPSVINYSTNAMYLDYIKVEHWAGSSNIYQKYYYEMLYSQDGKGILNMPIAPEGKRYWGENLEKTYKYLEAAEKESAPSLIAWSQTKTSNRKTTTTNSDYNGRPASTYSR